MLVYRTMLVASDGLPEVGRFCDRLGVRLPDHAKPNRSYDVVPKAGIIEPQHRNRHGRLVDAGLSTIPSDWRRATLAAILPEELGGSASGVLWELDVASVPSQLVVAETSYTHAVIGLTKPMLLADYDRYLLATRIHWRLTNVRRDRA